METVLHRSAVSNFQSNNANNVQQCSATIVAGASGPRNSFRFRGTRCGTASDFSIACDRFPSRESRFSRFSARSLLPKPRRSSLILQLRLLGDTCSRDYGRNGLRIKRLFDEGSSNRKNIYSQQYYGT